MSDNTVFQEVQAALLNSECDPNEAGQQGLCALYSFVATELEGSSLHNALTHALTSLRLPPPPYPGEAEKEPLRRRLRHDAIRTIVEGDKRKARRR